MYEDFFVFLISRYGRERMGLTEAEAVGKMWSGVKAMIQVGQPADVATDASSERVMKQKNCKQFLDCPITYIFEQALYSCCLSIILASLLTPALMYLLVHMLFVYLYCPQRPMTFDFSSVFFWRNSIILDIAHDRWRKTWKRRKRRRGMREMRATMDTTTMRIMTITILGTINTRSITNIMVTMVIMAIMTIVMTMSTMVTMRKRKTRILIKKKMIEMPTSLNT